MARQFWYTVHPRYTPGSSALVDETTAKRVAMQEKETYQRNLEGRYGDPDKHRAETQGLVGIVGAYTDKNRGKYTERSWLDLCTGEEGMDKLQEGTRWARFGPRCGVSVYPPGVSNAVCGLCLGHPGPCKVNATKPQGPREL